MPQSLSSIAAPFPGIAPVDGWRLFTFEERDSCGFSTPAYLAVKGDREEWLDVSRFRFTPSQDRFAWLVSNHFPARRAFGPWDDTEIEHFMATERLAA